MIELGARHDVAWLAASRSLTRRLGPSTGGLASLRATGNGKCREKLFAWGSSPRTMALGVGLLAADVRLLFRRAPCRESVLREGGVG